MNLSATIELYANKKLAYRTVFQGIPISVENRKGSIRRGVSKEWGPWKVKMGAPYGYVKGTRHLGMDKAELDVFIGPNKFAKNAFIFMIKKAPNFSRNDEEKVLLGYDSLDQAREAIQQHFDDVRFIGKARTMTMQDFRKWVTQKPSKIAAHLGEPQVYDGGYGHLEAIPTEHPPSLRNPKYIPNDNPLEKDDTYLDVTKRKDRATQAFRNRLTKQHPDANWRGLNRTLMVGLPSGTVGGFG